MKRWIAQFLFIYGCVGSGLCLLFLLYLALGQAAPAMHLEWFLGGFGVHGIVLCATFQRYPGLTFWRPVLEPTARNVARARGALLLTAALVALLGLAPAVVRLRAGVPTEAMAISFIAAFFLLSSVYIAVHWGLRPENMFSRTALRYLLNPLFEIGRLGYVGIRKLWKS